MSLSDRVSENPSLLEDLQNVALGHVEVAQRHATSETSVRRWRQKNGVVISTASMTTPYPSSMRPDSVTGRAPTAPKWEPGITIRNGEAEVRTTFAASEQTPDHKKLLEDAGLSPDEWKITRISPLVRKDEGMTAYWFRAVPFAAGPAVSVEDMDAILAQYINRDMAEQLVEDCASRSRTDRILMVPSGDLQLGKPERGGTEATIERFARYTNAVAEELAASGGVKLLVLPWLGDCIEGLVSQNGRNIASLDMPITQQVRVYRRLMVHQILTLAPYAENVLISVVPGNHDMTTREQTMPHTDSWAIEGASAAADYFKDREGFEHLSWAFPYEGESTVTLQVDPKLTVGFMHGHTSGKSRPEQIIDWWAKQSHGRQTISEADILVSAHWHHLRIQFTGGGRTWIQIPAMDGGSGWYREKSGEDVPSGQITIDLTPGVGAGWTNLKIYS